MSEHVLEEEQAMAEYEDNPDEQVLVDNDDEGTVELSGLVTPLVKLRRQNQQQSPSLKPRATSTLPTTGRSAVYAQTETSTSSISTSNTKLEEVAPKPMKMRGASAPTMAQLTCPICSKPFDTDNVGLNEHIDFCLSKGAILAATAIPHIRAPMGKTNRRTK